MAGIHNPQRSRPPTCTSPSVSLEVTLLHPSVEVIHLLLLRLLLLLYHGILQIIRIHLPTYLTPPSLVGTTPSSSPPPQQPKHSPQQPRHFLPRVLSPHPRTLSNRPPVPLHTWEWLALKFLLHLAGWFAFHTVNLLPSLSVPCQNLSSIADHPSPPPCVTLPPRKPSQQKLSSTRIKWDPSPHTVASNTGMSSELTMKQPSTRTL